MRSHLSDIVSTATSKTTMLTPNNRKEKLDGFIEQQNMAQERVTFRSNVIATEKVSMERKPRTFLDLPGEVRNQIYSLILRGDRIPFPTGGYKKGNPQLSANSDFLCVSKQIHEETKSWMAHICTVVVPIFNDWNYDHAAQAVAENTGREGGKYLTAFNSLADFLTIHFHCLQPVHKLDHKMIWVLYGAIRTFVSHSSRLCAGTTNRRRAVLHLRHLYIWSQRSVVSKMLATMSKAQCTDWECRIHIHKGRFLIGPALDAERSGGDMKWFFEEAAKCGERSS